MALVTSGDINVSESSLLSGNVYSDSDDSDFEPCLSISEYSRLILCLLLMSSGLVLLWLSCTTITTAPKHKITRKVTYLPPRVSPLSLRVSPLSLLVSPSPFSCPPLPLLIPLPSLSFPSSATKVSQLSAWRQWWAQEAE